MQKPPLILLMGATATGKTGLSLALARCFSAEIISVDSTMVYRGMDIGTAKPSTAVRNSVPHHLIDILNADQPYSAGQFCADSNKLIQEIEQRGNHPILVGGTHLYFQALTRGLAKLPRDATLRARLMERIPQEGLLALHQELQSVDPTAAKRIQPQDQQRIIRGLEIYYAAGKTWTEILNEGNQSHSSHTFLPIALNAPREELHRRIEMRFDQMLKEGLLEEVQSFFEQKERFSNTSAMRSVGYRQIWSYLNQEIDYPTMREQALAATRQLLKRQFTFLRQWPDLHWLNVDDANNVPKILELWQKKH